MKKYQLKFGHRVVCEFDTIKEIIDRIMFIYRPTATQYLSIWVDGVKLE